MMLRPASPGTGVIAGGAVRIVLEMAGVENALGKQLGSKNALNNAKATVAAVMKMRQLREVALERGIPMEELWLNWVLPTQMNGDESLYDPNTHQPLYMMLVRYRFFFVFHNIILSLQN